MSRFDLSQNTIPSQNVNEDIKSETFLTSQSVTLETKFNIGQSVQLITDIEKQQRMVTKIIISGSGHIEYYLANGIEATSHSEFEITEWEEQAPAKSQKHITGFGKPKQLE